MTRPAPWRSWLTLPPGWCVLVLSTTLCLRAAAPLGTVRKILDQSRETLTTRPPVHLQAVVTYIDSVFNLVFLQDQTAGIFLFRYTSSTNLTPGDFVDVTGVAASGRFMPLIDQAHVTLLGQTNLPAPKSVSLAEVQSGAHVGDYVKVRGVVRHVESHGEHLAVHVGLRGDECVVWVQSFAGFEKLNLVDAPISVRGVVAARFNQERLTGFQLHAHDLSDLEIMEPARDAFQEPAVPIAQLEQVAWRVGGHRVHVSATVTLVWSNQIAVLQDSSGGVMVEGVAAANLAVGDHVEAAGFIFQRASGSSLQNTEVRVGARGAPVAVAEFRPFVSRNAQLRLIHLRGQVLSWEAATNGMAVVALESSNALVMAQLPIAAASETRRRFPPGSLAEATGVLNLGRMDNWKPMRHSLWLRGPEDLVLVQSPPMPGFKAALLTGLAVALTLGVMGLLWRQRERKLLAASIDRERAAAEHSEDMQRQVLRSQRQREVMVQELHDNIIQSIYSVGLGLDEARRGTAGNPVQAAERVGVAIQGLNALIADVRTFIHGLEPKRIDGSDLRAALKSVVLDGASEEKSNVVIQIDAHAAANLTPLQATEVFYIAREAITNSRRHAQAGRITVSLQPQSRGVRLEVSDDGVGFDPQQVKDSSLGLRNMRARAENIGAKLDIFSAPRQGSRIQMDIPTVAHENH